MKITVLMEDTNRPDCVEKNEIIAEHGLSLYIETENHTLLMDTGKSDKTWENAKKLGVDPNKVDTLVLSHGHYDHSGGLITFAKNNQHAQIYIKDSAAGDYYHDKKGNKVYIGIDKEILNLPNIHFTSGIVRLDEELSVFSDVTERVLWPAGNLTLEKKLEDGTYVQDDFVHEQYLVIEENDRYYLISGCAHNGILNIIKKFQEIYGTDPDVVISGFHMMKKDPYTEEEIMNIEETARILSGMKTIFYSGHCTGEPAFALLKNIMGDQLLHMHSGDKILAE